MAIKEISGLGTVDITRPHPLNADCFHVAVGTSVVEIFLTRDTAAVSGRTIAGKADSIEVCAAMSAHFRALKGIAAPVVDAAANKAFDEGMCAFTDKQSNERKRAVLTGRKHF
tara:strand:- start:133 stop:471 length:339 start_codon:yes stop_codon:yes gene_type:complete